MDITFITMHDLSVDARILYASDSITDVFGYKPEDVVGKSSFDYFHPDEIPFARSIYGRGVHLDKAAVLCYCKIKRANGDYVCCECVFTVVYSVIVASTSLFRYTDKSQGRAIAAPAIRRAFSSSQRDPRYHMLSHLSAKFTTQPACQHEPRAALILNRFTRTLSILYATHALNDILGFPPSEAIGKSFYECIHECCLQDAVNALERAKENDSIAYLRFNWRDPRHRSMQRRHQIRLRSRQTQAGRRMAEAAESAYIYDRQDEDVAMNSDGDYDEYADGRSSSTSASSVSASSSNTPEPVIEVEAVVSCTSDGLVVIIRRARPLPPNSYRASTPSSGVFASPWAPAPLIPLSRPASVASSVPAGPPQADFMDSIRQVAVFAWCLRNINENLLQYAQKPEPGVDYTTKIKETPPPMPYRRLGDGIGGAAYNI